jgi:hypothetical protein
MAHVFSFVDGREVRAETPVELFEGLRRGEPLAPIELGRYLDLLRSRGWLGFGIDIEVGAAGEDITRRCQIAFESLVLHGWIRKARCVSFGATREVRAVS